MSIVLVACFIGLVALFWFSRVRWLMGFRRADLPEGSAVRRVDNWSSNLGCAVFILVLIALAGFYVLNFVLPWFQSHVHHGG